MSMRREIRAAYGVAFPKIPGKSVRFFCMDGESMIEAEVTADGEDTPEWSAECARLEEAVTAVCKEYGIGFPGCPCNVPRQMRTTGE